MSINNTITVSGIDPATGVKHSVRGTGATRAQALAELIARAALTVMTPLKGSESNALPNADYATVLFAAGTFADMELTLTKGVGYTDKVIRIANCTVSVRVAGSKGLVNITDPLITNFAAAYVDGDGVGGYSAVKGQFEE